MEGMSVSRSLMMSCILPSTSSGPAQCTRHTVRMASGSVKPISMMRTAATPHSPSASPLPPSIDSMVLTACTMEADRLADSASAEPARAAPSIEALRSSEEDSSAAAAPAGCTGCSSASFSSNTSNSTCSQSMEGDKDPVAEVVSDASSGCPTVKLSEATAATAVCAASASFPNAASSCSRILSAAAVSSAASFSSDADSFASALSAAALSASTTPPPPAPTSSAAIFSSWSSSSESEADMSATAAATDSSARARAALSRSSTSSSRTATSTQSLCPKSLPEASAKRHTDCSLSGAPPLLPAGGALGAVMGTATSNSSRGKTHVGTSTPSEGPLRGQATSGTRRTWGGKGASPSLRRRHTLVKRSPPLTTVPSGTVTSLKKHASSSACGGGGGGRGGFASCPSVPACSFHDSCSMRANSSSAEACSACFAFTPSPASTSSAAAAAADTAPSSASHVGSGTSKGRASWKRKCVWVPRSVGGTPTNLPPTAAKHSLRFPHTRRTVSSISAEDAPPPPPLAPPRANEALSMAVTNKDDDDADEGGGGTGSTWYEAHGPPLPLVSITAFLPMRRQPPLFQGFPSLPLAVGARGSRSTKVPLGLRAEVKGPNSRTAATHSSRTRDGT
mmetsp:Transcript_6149/g.11544  ORF Transcript_6149/g.11544 Transcript_6149/m.11544 type:complete len:622 (+) Transcript_6149:315-2180(+)